MGTIANCIPISSLSNLKEECKKMNIQEPGMTAMENFAKIWMGTNLKSNHWKTLEVKNYVNGLNPMSEYRIITLVLKRYDFPSPNSANSGQP